MEQLDVVNALLWYAAFIVSVTAHEAAHALAAYLGGDPTAYRAGQVSLNPRPHMRREPFGMILVPAFTALTQGWCIGWASTPYDPAWANRYPRRAAWMAAAGPAANLAIALAVLLLLRIGLGIEIFGPPEQASFSKLVVGDAPLSDAVGRLLSILLVLNVILFAFNLIPFPPLDGAAAIGLLLPEELALRLRTRLSSPSFAIFGLLIAWWLFADLIGPLFALVLRLVHPEFVYG